MIRCPGCRSRRASFKSMQQHVQRSGHALCGCGGYHYSHRPGSPFCDLNPLAELRRAVRTVGGDEEMVREIVEEWIMDHGTTGDDSVCPF